MPIRRIEIDADQHDYTELDARVFGCIASLTTIQKGKPVNVFFPIAILIEKSGYPDRILLPSLARLKKAGRVRNQGDTWALR